MTTKSYVRVAVASAVIVPVPAANTHCNFTVCEPSVKVLIAKPVTVVPSVALVAFLL
jgi:hypothetical protein